MLFDRSLTNTERPLHRARVVALVLEASWLVCATAAAGYAQVLPLGPEVQVNSFTSGSQLRPRVTVAEDGTFVVVWGSYGQGDEAVRARRFDAVGSPLGDEIPVSQANPGFPSDLSVAADGEFVVVWGRSDLACPPECDVGYISGRMLTVEGIPDGSQFAVSPPPGSLFTGYSSVASHPGGEFVVVWYENGLFGRQFSADALPLGAIFPIAPGRPEAFGPTVETQAAGTFLVSWSDTRPGDTCELRAQRYAADATPVGAELILAGPRTGTIRSDLATEAGGNFLATWTNPHEAGSSVQVEAARFEGDGSPIGTAFQVNTYSASARVWEIRLHRDRDGGFVVVWSSTGSPGDDSSLDSFQARRLAQDGTPLGPQFQVNSYTTGFQLAGDVGSAPNGDLVFVWQSDGSFGNDNAYSSVQVRRFRTPFFVDGFESGDTGRWSSGSSSRSD